MFGLFMQTKPSHKDPTSKTNTHAIPQGLDYGAISCQGNRLLTKSKSNMNC